MGLVERVTRRKTAEMEAELPLALRTVGMLLELRVPFHTALEYAAEGVSPLSKELKRAVSEIKKGAGVPSVLSELGNRVDSIPIKRALSQISATYEKGKGGKAILRVADDLLKMQVHAMRMASSRQAVFSLLFIVLTAVLPAFLLIFASLGEFSPLPPLSEPALIILFLVLLPALSAAVLIASLAFVPRGILQPKSRGKGALIALSVCILFAVFQLLSLPALPVLLVLFGGMVLFAYPKYKEDRRREQLEEQLPEAVFSASGQEIGGLGPLFSSMRHSPPPLKDEVEISLKQVKANVKQGDVLEDFWARNKSELLRRFSMFLNQALHAGHAVSEYISLIAADMLSIFELRRQRKEVLAMQRYTLLFGALIVPFILGSSLNLSADITAHFDSAGPSILETIIPPYLAFYAFLSALFISQTEGKDSALYIYFPVLALVSTSIFYLF